LFTFRRQGKYAKSGDGGKPLGKWSLGSWSTVWEASIMLELREVGCKDGN
jgi:hypothetical protein